MRTCGAGPCRATGRRRHERFLLGDVMVGKRRKASRTREAFRKDVRRRPTLHPVTRAVPSALKGLASGFGMGPGVSPSLLCRRNSMELWPHLVAEMNRPQLGSCTVDA